MGDSVKKENERDRSRSPPLWAAQFVHVHNVGVAELEELVEQARYVLHGVSQYALFLRDSRGADQDTSSQVITKFWGTRGEHRGWRDGLRNGSGCIERTFPKIVGLEGGRPSCQANIEDEADDGEANTGSDDPHGERARRWGWGPNDETCIDDFMGSGHDEEC